MNPYGHLSVGPIEIHYVTIVCVTILYLVYYRRMSYVNHKLLRLSLPLLYCLAATTHYEIVWNFGWAWSKPILILEVIGFCLCEYIIIRVTKDFKRPVLPQIDFDRFIVITAIMMFGIALICTTDFYYQYDQLRLGLSDIDPHNLEWALSKLTLIFWIWMTPARRKR